MSMNHMASRREVTLQSNRKCGNDLQEHLLASSDDRKDSDSDSAFSSEAATRRIPDRVEHRIKEGGISLIELVRSLRGSSVSGSRVLSCGGIEAVPCVSGDDVARRLQEDGFCSLPQLMQGRFEVPAITGVNGGSIDAGCTVRHGSLAEFVAAGGGLAECGVTVGDRVGVLLPNGPEMAVCMLACMATCVAMPINHQMTVAEVISELSRTGAAAVIIQSGEDDDEVCAAAGSLGIKVIHLTKYAGGSEGLFSLSVASGHEMEAHPPCRRVMNGPTDVALLLHTSGTSGTKKAVPYSLLSLITGAACIIHSWGIREDDICINMMPLFHVGGIVRNLLAPVLSGGTVVCARAFDPALFWEACVEHHVTWYYAGPTMHQLLLEELGPEAKPPRGCRIRMVFNASGGLSHALATKIVKCFGCCVLPCYGMTECMPISTPPIGYSLERPGTSGVMCGPRARVYGSDGNPKKAGEIGNLCLQGAPMMSGYEGAETPLIDGGWFNTGDTGYIDQDGWIYITGRSKEVINRGGEIISPFEVEEAIQSHERVRSVLAFSAPHEVLQEVVGCLVVPEPGRPRVDLIGLQKHAAKLLHPSKWPQVLVFIDELPKTGATGKMQRINLAARFGIGAVKETHAQTQRMFDADTPLAVCSPNAVIRTRVVGIDLQEVMRVMRLVQGKHGVEQCVVISGHHEHRKDAVCAYVTPKTVDTDSLCKSLRMQLHDYLVPIEIVTLDLLPNDPGGLPLPALKGLLNEHVHPRNQTESIIQDIWTFVLGGEPSSVHADFFERGGTSLLAGRLIAKVRGALGVPMTAASIFQCRTIAALALKADEMGAKCPAAYKRLCEAPGHASPEPAGVRGMSPSPDGEGEAVGAGTRGGRMWGGKQMRLSALIAQALPLSLMYPLRRIVTWLIFVTIWLYLQLNLRLNRLEALVIALALERLIAEIFFPILSIWIKWVVIGRYREGAHRLWSNYYLRWWLVDQTLLLFGRGIFRRSNYGLSLYYRLMGASIGRCVRFDQRTQLAEFDLISIGDGCAIDDVVVRAFCVEGSRMSLNRVVIGEGCTVCTKVSIVPGIRIPPGTCLGPLSSTYAMLPEDTPASNKLFCKKTFPEPHVYLKAVGYIIMALIWAVMQAPLLLVLRSMCLQPWYKNVLSGYGDVLEWFLTPQRIGFYVALRIVRAIAQPMIKLACGIIVKKCIIGKFTPGSRKRSSVQIWKHWLMGEVLPSEDLQEVLQLIGVHYDGVSVILRMLGAKCGERIYWPGSGFQGLVEYDLLEVGNDVIFGSRSVVMCCDADEALPIRILEGSNVADRCVLLPGCTLERNALLGSGGLGSKGSTFPAGSKSVGSKQGRAVLLEPGSEAAGKAPTLRPFGKAFYDKNAPYWVIPIWVHAAIASLSKSFAVTYRALTLSLALLFTSISLEAKGTQPVDHTFADVASSLVPLYIATQNGATVLALLLAIIAKWGILARRSAGEFDWDQSSYCQRWHVYLALTGLIRNAYFGRGLLEYIQGSVYLVWYFRALGAKIGKDTCLYPTGADPMMTEPELVTIGSEVSVDRASLVAHINSMGRFSLNPVTVGAKATLRSDSRLLSGATMLQGSTLLEHTLILGGDVVDEGSTWQGWPGQMVAMTQNRALSELDIGDGFVGVGSECSRASLLSETLQSSPAREASGSGGGSLGRSFGNSAGHVTGQAGLSPGSINSANGSIGGSSFDSQFLAARGRGMWASPATSSQPADYLQ